MTTEPETILVAVRRTFGEVQDHQIVTHLETLHGIESVRPATAADAAKVVEGIADSLLEQANARPFTQERFEHLDDARLLKKAARRVRGAEAARENEENNAH